MAVRTIEAERVATGVTVTAYLSDDSGARSGAPGVPVGQPAVVQSDGTATFVGLPRNVALTWWDGGSHRAHFDTYEDDDTPFELTRPEDYGAPADGTNSDSEAFARMVDDLPAAGPAFMVLTDADYKLTVPWDLDDRAGIVVKGLGGQRAGVKLSLSMSGGATGISMRSAQSCVLEGLTIKTDSLDGILIDQSSDPADTDSSQNEINRCRLFMPQHILSTNVGVLWRNSYQCSLWRCWITGGKRQVEGVRLQDDFVNLNTIERCNFGLCNDVAILNLQAFTDPLLTPLNGSNSAIRDCVFEALFDGSAGGYRQDAGKIGGALNIECSRFEDASGVGQWVVFNGGPFRVAGCYFAHGVDALATSAAGGVLSSEGNGFRSLTNPLNEAGGALARRTWFGGDARACVNPMPAAAVA